MQECKTNMDTEIDIKSSMSLIISPIIMLLGAVSTECVAIHNFILFKWLIKIPFRKHWHILAFQRTLASILFSWSRVITDNIGNFFPESAVGLWKIYIFNRIHKVNICSSLNIDNKRKTYCTRLMYTVLRNSTIKEKHKV